jgi:CheY-like chemotaxis protein
MLTTAARQDQTYDVVLIHCQELEADALDFATRARTTEALAALRLIFIATNGKKGDAHLVRQAGYDAYLTYPVSPSLLFECLVSVLGQVPQSPGSDLPLVTRYTLAEARTRGRSRILIVNSSLPEQKHAVRLVEELGYRADIALLHVKP